MFETRTGPFRGSVVVGKGDITDIDEVGTEW